MKTVQINKVKVRIFEEDELREKLGMVEKDIKLVSTYQRIFPELLQDDSKGFINSARKLYLELGLNESQWSRWSNKNIIESKFFSENDDWEVLDIESTTSKGGRIAKDYKITIEMAKHLCMKVDNENGHDFRQYFIIIEKTLRNYEKWIEVRIPERKNANIMRSKIKEWCIKNGYDVNEGSYAREFNMINIAVTGNTALGIRLKLGYSDKQTREHLETKKNAIIDKMQEINITLLELNMSFEDRKQFVEDKCNNEYNDLKFAV